MESAEALLARFEDFVTSNIYLLTAVIVVAHIIGYNLLSEHPLSAGKSPSLRISEIYVYPIKSLRPTQLSQALATKHGFEYDRRYMLLQKTAEGYKNMAVSKYPEMTQFLTNILPPDQDSPTSGSIEVEYVASGNAKSNRLTVPLRPDTTKLEPLKIDMHGSPTDAFQMPAEYSTWFSECFGYEVVLAYLGNNLRDVLFEDMNTKTAKSAFSRLLASLPVLGTYSTSDYKITFADCSPYLITSKTSLADVSARLPDGEEMDMTKFRPNIVVTGAKDAYEEDYWGSLDINGAKVTLAHNCVRCSSLNVDYNTGKPGTGESGQVLKKLQKDRRVDPGHKWSPVFGRYSFWNSRQGPKTLSVGDEVKVTKVNIQRTKWNWPGI